MSGYVCRSCRASLRCSLRPQRCTTIAPIRTFNSDTLFDGDATRSSTMRDDKREAGDKSKEEALAYDGKDDAIPEDAQGSRAAPGKRKLVDVSVLLSTPTWSVRSLLPDRNIPAEEEITPEKLNHLLRLSALPLPKTRQETVNMLKILHEQLHFVRDIQKVNTDGVEPLRAICDETEMGMKGLEIGMEQLKEAFAKEDIKGRNRRPRRRRGEPVDTKGVEDWDVLGAASETVEMNGAIYFVVRSGKRPASYSGGRTTGLGNAAGGEETVPEAEARHTQDLSDNESRF